MDSFKLTRKLLAEVLTLPSHAGLKVWKIMLLEIMTLKISEKIHHYFPNFPL